MEVLLPLSAAVIALGILLLWRRYSPSVGAASWRTRPKSAEQPEKDPYEAIEPLPKFDWASTEPIRIRPFKPKYHMTMGRTYTVRRPQHKLMVALALENMPLSNLIEMDNTFKDRMAIRRSILDEHPEETKQCNSVAEAAVLEHYDWMVSTYLPRRFPTIYKPISTASGTQLHNTVSGTDIPRHIQSPMAALDTLGEHVDTDFLILLPSSTASDGSPIYHLEAFVTCFPAGFSTREKCGNPLAAIHKPVPGYAAKLEKSMDRFFAKLELGRAVKRANWSISTNDQLYSEGGNHMYADNEKKEKPLENAKTLDVNSPHLDEDVERQRREVIVEDCRLRCERQTLHRLPKTKALVFSFKTYLYTLSEVKAEGSGPELAAAIDGLGQGSVPAIAFYKRGVVWGDKVKEYLLG